MTRDDDTSGHARGDTITGAVTVGPVVTRHASAGPVSGTSQAVRDGSQRNDLAAAQVQLEAARASRQNDERALALRRDAQARADRAQQTADREQAASTEMRAPETASIPNPNPTSTKGGRYGERRGARHERSGRASSYAHDQRTFDTWVAGFAGNDAVSSGTARGGAPIAALTAVPPSAPKVGRTKAGGPGLPPLLPDPARAVQAAQSAQATPPMQAAPLTSSAAPTHSAPSSQQAELTAQTTTPVTVMQAAPSDVPQTRVDGGPKTRAQVQAEIIRARGDGSLPAFGNPNPAGPGGAPSLTIVPGP
ncbi:hypothetical protein [Paraburkholderia sp. BCC1884]|uniref:hypothetical protein n=1 Tax=Paraburkholderia sp. BCC1884 TaxID=2562668 RepID=UPI00164246D3|nr:hypothetical protein [Paraburkholderia sp. BCC1884]